MGVALNTAVHRKVGDTASLKPRRVPTTSVRPVGHHNLVPQILRAHVRETCSSGHAACRVEQRLQLASLVERQHAAHAAIVATSDELATNIDRGD